jgi:hypothetical protein
LKAKTRILAAIGLGMVCLLRAADTARQDEPKQRVHAGKTERIDFPSGGTLRFRNSVGVLTVEAWDQPDVEITTIKEVAHEPDRLHVAAERHGDEVVVTTAFPWHRPFRLPYPLSGEARFGLEYRVKAPANARIIVDHGIGEVNIDGLAGDIQVTLAKGEILLHLPEEQKYSINAKSDFGNVTSDFSEAEKRTWWLAGHRNASGHSAAPHNLSLRVGFGDIVILKTRVPKFPEPTTLAPKANGL